MADGMDFAIDNFKSQLTELKQKISRCRKKGMDAKIAELKIIAIPSKIRMLEVTRDLKDVQKISKMVNDALIEVNELENGVIHDEKSEEPESQEHILDKMILEAEYLVSTKKLKEAKEIYLKGIDIYKNIKSEGKKSAFEKLNSLRASLLRS